MIKYLGQLSFSLLAFSAACTADGEGQPPIDPPQTELSAIERCLAEGGSLRELWSVGNQHGPVTSIAAAGTTVVLGSADGSVKQWNLDGASPSYGTPFVDDTGIAVGALAMSPNGHLVGADRSGRVSQWRLSDAQPMGTTTVADAALTVVGIEEHGKLAGVAHGVDSPDVRVIDLATAAVSEPLATTLWGVSSVVFGHGRVLFTAGHWYGVPMIERRSLDAPDTVVAEWAEMTMHAHVTAIAVDPYVTRMVAAGTGFVAVLDPDALDTSEPAIHELGDFDPIAIALVGRDVFATVTREGTLQLWSATTTEPLAAVTVPAPVGLAVDEQGSTLFTSGADGELHAFGCR